MTDELLPCPLCGGRKIGGPYKDDREGLLYLECLSTPGRSCVALYGPTVVELVRRWNTRPLDQRDAEIRRLETAVLDATFSDRVDEAGSPLSWAEIAQAAEQRLKAVTEALEACFVHVVGRETYMDVRANGWQWPDDAPEQVSVLAEKIRQALAASPQDPTQDPAGENSDEQ